MLHIKSYDTFLAIGCVGIDDKIKIFLTSCYCAGKINTPFVFDLG